MIPLFFIMMMIIPYAFGSVDKQFLVDCHYEYNIHSMKANHRVLINGKSLRCYCGKDPVSVLILYGDVQGYCLDHFQDLLVLQTSLPEYHISDELIHFPPKHKKGTK